MLYGDHLNGITTAGNQTLNFDFPGVLGGPVAGAEYGSALAVGDLDGNGAPDLAIGIPQRPIGGVAGAGSVHVVYAVPGIGLQTTAPADEFIDQGTLGADVELGDRFGSALAIGSFDPVAGPALAIGTPDEDLGAPLPSAGIVHVVGHGVGGLDPLSVHTIGAATPPIPIDPQPFARFGAALAAGDLDGDGIDELVIGVPGQEITVLQEGIPVALPNAGDAVVAWGGAGFSGGFDATTVNAAAQAFSSESERGFALAAGDHDGDGRATLAVGAPGRAIGGHPSAGAVEVFDFPGRVELWSGTLDQDQNQPWTSNAGNDALSGFSLAFLDSNGDGIADLIAGTPGDSIGLHPAAGSVIVYAARHIFVDGFESGAVDAWSAVVP